RDIINNYPFPNTFKVLEMTGKGIREALEQSARYFDLTDSGDVGINDTFLNPKPQHYNYDIFGGVSYNIKVSEPMGHRVHDIKVEGQPLVEDKIYTVCVNNYRAVGGGDYNMFAEAKVVKDIQVEGAQLLIDYLTHHNLNNMPQVVDFKVEI
ncbi:5'-nucleotidase C-terminal domain-containing protein, partial [Escherichia coli]